jgi:hypothetical protein
MLKINQKLNSMQRRVENKNKKDDEIFFVQRGRSHYKMFENYILIFFLNIFLVCPIRLPLFLLFFLYVIASIAYIHPVYSAGVLNPGPLDRKPSALTTRPWLSPYFDIISINFKRPVEAALSDNGYCYQLLLRSDCLGPICSTLQYLTLSKLSYAYHLVNVISFCQSQSDHIKGLPLYIKCGFVF